MSLEKTPQSDRAHLPLQAYILAFTLSACAGTTVSTIQEEEVPAATSSSAVESHADRCRGFIQRIVQSNIRMENVLEGGPVDDVPENPQIFPSIGHLDLSTSEGCQAAINLVNEFNASLRAVQDLR